jgi:hypothetical protein
MPPSELFSMKGSLSYCEIHSSLTKEESANCKRWAAHIDFLTGTSKSGEKIDLESLIDTVTMYDILDHFGIHYNKTMYNIKCVLPDHQDKTASLKIYQ